MPQFDTPTMLPRKPVNVKTIIYLTLFAVALLHLVSSLPVLNRSHPNYIQAERVYYLNDVSDDLYTAVGNFGFERGRVNVVLNDAGPVDGMQSNRQFITARRHDGNQALERALSKLQSSGFPRTDEKIRKISRLQKGIQVYRGKVDQNITIPKAEREADLAEQWFSAMTRYIETIETLPLAISSDISDADGMINRYSILKHETLVLRNTAGPEMSILSATMLSGNPIRPPLTSKIQSFQIRTRFHFENLTLLNHPLADPAIPQAPFDIVIMDLAIPGGKGGVQAFKDVLEIDPPAKVIVASGYSSDPVMDNFSAFGLYAAIAKPFKFQELLDIIKQL